MGCLWGSIPNVPLCKCDLQLGQTSQVSVMSSEMSVAYGPGTKKNKEHVVFCGWNILLWLIQTECKMSSEQRQICIRVPLAV